MLNRELILAAAWHCFEEGGEAGLTVRATAARLGVTPMALYRHFDSRQALVDALVADAVEDWRARVSAIAPAAPCEWFSAIGAAYLDFALGQPRRFDAAFLLRSSAALRYPDDFLAGKSSAGDLQLDLLERLGAGADRQALSDGLVGLAALAQGLVTLYRAGRIAGDEAAFRALYLRQVGRYLRALAAPVAA